VVMKAISSEQFLAWADEGEIWPDDRYQEPRCLVFRGTSELWRFWNWPRARLAIAGFSAHLLDGLEPWSDVYLWRRGGVWPGAYPTLSVNDEVEAVILAGVGVPSGHEGAMVADHRSRAEALAVLFAAMMFGFAPRDDVFVLPDHRRAILWADHHRVVHALFKAEEDLERFVEHMRRAGHELPEEAPDATFKPVSWMGDKPQGTDGP
jgi:hypothetical protein